MSPKTTPSTMIVKIGMSAFKKKMKPGQNKELLDILRIRFEENMSRHDGVERWLVVGVASQIMKHRRNMRTGYWSASYFFQLHVENYFI